MTLNLPLSPPLLEAPKESPEVRGGPLFLGSPEALDAPALFAIPPDFDWKAVVAPFEKADNLRACFQIATSVLPLLLGWVLMFFALQVSWLLTFLLALPTAGFIMRTLIVGHDCGHNSFFSSSRANAILGSILGIPTLTPFQQWRRGHNIHHATAGNLDHRSDVDIYTLSVLEYLALPAYQRLAYRIYRHPFFLLAVAPLLKFFLLNRLWDSRTPRHTKRVVLLNDLLLFALLYALSALLGVWPILVILSSTFWIAGSFGILLFYVQHQFEDSYWQKHSSWEYVRAALHGSTFFKLPPWLTWFSGNIGFHHIHHLSPRVPNYRLEACHNSHPLFQKVRVVSFFESFGLFSFNLWDEKTKKMVSFRDLKARLSGVSGSELVPSQGHLDARPSGASALDLDQLQGHPDRAERVVYNGNAD